jgi:site-specific recombinase XerD
VKLLAYELRHRAATLVVDGLGLEHAQSLLGHSDVATTRHYARTAERQAIEAAARLVIPQAEVG